MLYWLKQRWRMDCILLGSAPVVATVALLSAANVGPLAETDYDNDHMPDAYELFFGLESTNSADAGLNYDHDDLANLEESQILTDPFCADTDRDLFPDDQDAVPISRAYIQWGSPRFTTGDQYDYAHPDWFLGAYKNGGEWVVDAAASRSAWLAAADDSHNASLSIDLDRAVLTNNLRYAVHYCDNRNTALYLDLLDTNGVVIVEDLYGNLMTGTNEDTILLLNIPTAELPEAAVIQLRCGEAAVAALTDGETGRTQGGDVLIYEGLLYIDEDGDRLDANQERQLGTSDYRIDTNGNGTNDYDEVFLYHTDPALTNNVPIPDPSDDGVPEPCQKGVVYVDQARGNDSFTGRSSDIAGFDGPKKTIHKGLVAVGEDDAKTLVIKSGAYHENLDVRGKNVNVFIEGNVKL